MTRTAGSQDFGQHGREFVSSETGLRLLELLADDAELLRFCHQQGIELQPLQRALQHTLFEASLQPIPISVGPCKSRLKCTHRPCANVNLHDRLFVGRQLGCSQHHVKLPRVGLCLLPGQESQGMGSVTFRGLRSVPPCRRRCCRWRTSGAGTGSRPATCASVRTGAASTPTAIGRCIGGSRSPTMTPARSTRATNPSGGADVCSCL